MRKVKRHGWIMAIGAFLLFISCEREFNIDIKTNQPQLVVEGYINNLMPLYNYVILSKSKNYYEPGFQNTPVTGALVSVTEGVMMANDQYQWDETSTRQLKEARLPQLGNAAFPGFYFDPLLATDSVRALKGRPGKHYRLQIEAEGKKYSAITSILYPLTIDSLTSGFRYMDDDEDKDTIIEKARITVHFKDPDTIGNTQLYFWRHWGNRNSFGWGALGSNRYIPGTDDLVNGQYIHLTHSYGFVIGDTVEYFMANVDRKVYNFWDSFNKARNNGGPFATPVSLLNTITGENVTGCFSGFSISTKTVIVR
ncbi:DUF4249 domain-containing protein [Paraflavitalea speifideaquila]|uniref:DUF4249 domain-containing protein n=1 Tax=Paraflavitalea speifideaquila TaxID=3076558 RepID=UPI0028E400E7|nr:DUF4249 domain-containing protein [Paraflavitalea speifideiaquila]